MMQNSRNTALTDYTDVNSVSCCKLKLLRATEVADKVHINTLQYAALEGY